MDIEYIKESYTQMPDEELVKLLKHEASQLTGEARAVLQQELAKRNLGNSFEEALAKEKDNELKRNEAKAKKKAEDDFVNSVLNYVFEAKYNRASNQEIKEGLMKQGIEEEKASLVLAGMEDKAREHLKDSERNMMIGLLVLIAGTAITYFTYQAASDGGGVYVVAWGAMLFGLLRFFQSIGLQHKFKKILDHVKSGKEA